MSFVHELLQGLFSGYKSARPHRRDWEYDWLNHENYIKNYNMLHSSQYLNELYEMARTDEQKDSILEHIYRYNVEDIASYKAIEKKIIDERWKEDGIRNGSRGFGNADHIRRG